MNEKNKMRLLGGLAGIANGFFGSGGGIIAVPMLKKAGFKSIAYYSDFGEYQEECERIIFVVKKVRN